MNKIKIQSNPSANKFSFTLKLKQTKNKNAQNLQNLFKKKKLFVILRWKVTVYQIYYTVIDN